MEAHPIEMSAYKQLDDEARVAIVGAK